MAHEVPMSLGMARSSSLAVKRPSARIVVMIQHADQRDTCRHHQRESAPRLFAINSSMSRMVAVDTQRALIQRTGAIVRALDEADQRQVPPDPSRPVTTRRKRPPDR